MFLLKLLRLLFRRKKRNMALEKKPYSLRYADHEFKFMMPRYKKVSHMLTDKAIERRMQTCRFYDRRTIQDLLVLNSKINEPYFVN